MEHRNTERGTCVIGEYVDMTAFASIAADGNVWAKQYDSVADAVHDVKRLGLIENLFATTAPRYISETKRPCISSLVRTVDPKKILAAGFRAPGETHVARHLPA